MTIMPQGMRILTTLLVTGTIAVSAGAAAAQEDATSAAQRPLVHAPSVAPLPPKPADKTPPKWADFPAPPTDVPTVGEIAQRVQTQTSAATQLKTEVAALVWNNTDAASYAEAVRARLNPAFLQHLDATLSRQEIEDLAAELHRRATPPPMAD